MPGIPKPPIGELEKAGMPQLARWLTQLHKDGLRKVTTINQTLTPTELPSRSGATQTFTVKGLKTDDAVKVYKPSHTTNIQIFETFVSADDELSIVFYNNDATGPVTPPEEVYKIVATRITND